MAIKKTARKAERARREILGKSISLLALGFAFYFASFLVSTHAMLSPVAKGLRSLAPFAIGIGALLFLLYYALGRASRPSNSEPARFPALQPDPGRREPQWQARFDSPNPRPGVVELDRAARTGAESWCGKVFDEIEWRRFEAVCEALFAQAGFQAKSQSHGADGGVDIWLYSRHSEGPASVVQCKHWRRPVGVKEVREFFGVMTANRLKRGTFATSSTFTADARQFAKENGISALDRSGLLSLIAKRSDEQQQELLRVAYEGEYWRPTCASCGTKMVERSRKTGGDAFWGCAQYPRCRSTLPRSSAGAS